MLAKAKKRHPALLAMAAGVLLLLASCGEEKAENREAAGFRYALSGTYPPFSYFDENDRLTGFDVEIGRALATAMGLEAKPIATPWQSLPLGLNAGRYDAIIGSMTITKERLEQFNFSDPYYRSGPMLFVRKNSPIGRIEELPRDATVAVLMESVYEELAASHSDNLKFYDSDVLALRDLNTGRADAVITDRVVGLSNIRRQNLEIKPVGNLLMVEEIGIAVRKGDNELLERLNRALAAIKTAGTYHNLSQKFIGADISGD